MRYNRRGAPQWRPLECPSRVMGNYHARFLGGKGAERPLTYPVRDTKSHDCMCMLLYGNTFSPMEP
jgi:hypothetical protein